MIVLTFVGGVLRMALVQQPIRYDEAFTYLEYASRGLDYTITSLTRPNNHILHTGLVAITTGIFGDSLLAIRLPAFAAGVLTIPCTYFACRTMYGKHAALGAAGLVASSSALIEYSTNARGYSLVCLFTVVLTGLGGYLFKRPNTAAWLLLASVSALGLFTVPTMLYPAGAVMLWIGTSFLFYGRSGLASKKRQLTCFVVSGLATAVMTTVLYVPTFAGSGLSSISDAQALQPVSWSRSLADLQDLFVETRDFWTRDIPFVLVLVILSGLLAYILFRQRFERSQFPLALACLLTSAALTVAVQRVPVKTGVWVFLVPLVFFWTSAGLAHMWRRIPMKSLVRRDLLYAIGILLVSLWVGVRVLQSGSVLASVETGALPSAEEIALYLEETLRPGDALVSIFPSDAPLHYYFKRHGLSDAYFYIPNQPFAFDRALVVVNTTTNQPLEDVITKTGIADRVNLESMRIVRMFDTARLVEVMARHDNNGEAARNTP
jgi:hypothetical protein